MNKNIDSKTLTGPAKGLLRLLEETGEQTCADLVREGEQQRAELRRKAFSRARQRVHQAVDQERKRMAQSLARVEAEIETAQRKRILRHDARLVSEGRELLGKALHARWQQPEARKAWAAALVDVGARVIIARDWLIECPPDWPDNERLAMAEYAATACGARVEIRPCESIDAGLRLLSGGLCVDMRKEGLLADHDRIDSALLALCEDRQAGGNP